MRIGVLTPEPFLMGKAASGGGGHLFSNTSHKQDHWSNYCFIKNFLTSLQYFGSDSLPISTCNPMILLTHSFTQPAYVVGALRT